jgi:hypothetical protein
MPKSIYSEPMPSPNGTNYERLYIIRRPFAEAMAFDAAMPAATSRGYGSADDDPDDFNPAAPDTEEKVRELLGGKLSLEDLDALCDLIFSDDTDTASMPAAPAPAAQDRGRRRQAADRMPSRATMERLVAEGAARRADRVLKQHADLVKRFPALASARVA